MNAGKIIVDKRYLNFVINQYLNNNQNSFRKAATDVAEQRLDKIKDSFFKVFDEHPVTQDIEGGPDGNSIILPIGNLFSFLGFDEGQTPIENLRQFLQNSITLDRPTYSRDTRLFKFPVQAPTIKDINDEAKEDTPEWAHYASWVEAVEVGVSNLSQYLYDEKQNFNNSRSGTAIQVKNTVNVGFSFNGVDYMTGLMQFLTTYLK